MSPGDGGVRWRWPAAGPLIGRDSAAGATTTPGVDIAGSAGAPVRAAGDGVVLYSGDGYPGYEGLIVIRHDDNWLSSYAHNRERLVGDGQRVKAGDKIAEMGRVGVSRDMLHFELRHDGAAVDPLRYLPKR